MSKNFFVISGITTGRLNAFIKNIMRQMNITDPEEAIRLINSGRWSVVEKPPKWILDEESGIIYFTVTSDGTTGPEWVKRLRNNTNIYCDSIAEEVLISEDFKPTSGLTTEIAILNHHSLPKKDGYLFTSDLWEEAIKRKLQKPSIETGCLIREKFSNRELDMMGIGGILMMHTPVVIDDSYLDIKSQKNLLLEIRYDREYPRTDYFSAGEQTGHALNENFGFAFALYS